MSIAKLEHANVTVANARATAEELCRLFDWKIRWQGEAKDNGFTVHVGEEDSYLAIYTPASRPEHARNTYDTRGGLNHLGIVVEDLDLIEKRVVDAGYTPVNHADYEPGKRFYFRNADQIEIEVVSYP